MVKNVTAVASLVIVTGCGGGLFGDAHNCAPVAEVRGLTLDVKAPLAHKAASATMKVCWDGVCRNPPVHLAPSTRAVPQGCTGDRPDDVCGASASPTGDKHGIVPLQDLPLKPVEVTVVLLDAAGDQSLNQRITVTPTMASPGPGRTCGGSAPQAHLVVDGGQLRPRD